jgi:hypothetical protein
MEAEYKSCQRCGWALQEGFYCINCGWMPPYERKTMKTEHDEGIREFYASKDRARQEAWDKLKAHYDAHVGCTGTYCDARLMLERLYMDAGYCGD